MNQKACALFFVTFLQRDECDAMQSADYAIARMSVRPSVADIVSKRLSSNLFTIGTG